MDTNNYSVSLQTLLATELPARTKSYTPISHKEIIERTHNELQKKGFVIANETYSASSDGQIGQGNYVIQYGNDPDMQLKLAWQNSYNKMISFKYVSGGSVMVCSNGIAHGDWGAYRRVHKGTADGDAIKTITEQIQSAEEKFQELIEMKEKMKQITLNKRQMAEIAGRWFIEEEMITSTQLNIIKKQIDNPSYDYGTSKNTLWDTFNAATHAFKGDHPSTYLKRHVELSTWTANEFGLRTPESTSIYIPSNEIIPA